jgi:sulfur-oxidizing protein SoxX
MGHSLRTLAALLVLLLPALAVQGASDEEVAEGREIAGDRNQGNCYSCHMAPGAEMAGNSGPPLMQMRMRYPDREVLKAQIADPRVRNPQTVMPPYGAHGILTDRELERVVDYLLTL